MITQFETSELWRTTDKEFRVIARYCPTEDNDTWIEYENCQTNERYTCRLEAFLGRFTPSP
jgi:uncharacterized protein (DUF1684 family)